MSERNIITIPVTGRIDSYTSSGLQAKVDAALAQHPDGIIFDFDTAAYISSAGLRALMQLSRASGNSRQPLAIAGRQPAVKRKVEKDVRVLQLPRLHGPVKVRVLDDLPQASLRRGPAYALGHENGHCDYGDGRDA